MQFTETSQANLEANESELARGLQRQAAEWRATRAAMWSRTSSGVPVERRFKRRPGASLLQV